MHDGDASRRLAKATIKEVYDAQQGLDDDMFEDAAELVGVLGRMMKRGAGSGTPGSTPRMGGSSGTKSTPRMSGGENVRPTMGMDNPI